MIELLKIKLDKTPIYLCSTNDGEIKDTLLLVEHSGLFAIYDQDDKRFGYVRESVEALNEKLARQELMIKKIPEEQYRICSEPECGKVMQEGYVFESDGTTYCDMDCLTKNIPYKEYLKIHDDGNGDAYFTDWYDC